MSEIKKPFLTLMAEVLNLDANHCWPFPKLIANPRRDGPPRINLTRYLYTLLIGDLTLQNSLERRSTCVPGCQNPFHRNLAQRGLTSTLWLKNAKAKPRYTDALLAEARDLAHNIREILADAPTMSRSEIFNWFSTQDPNFLGLTLDEFVQTISDNPDIAQRLP